MLLEVMFLIFTLSMMGLCLSSAMKNKNFNSAISESFSAGIWFTLFLARLIFLLTGGL